VDASALLPLSRWDVDAHAELFGGLPVRFGPTLDGIELFDPGALALSEAEAALMDPQQRLLLELTAELLLAAGPRAGKGSVGTYVGLSSTDYAKVR
jgi:acyl transferase domain-containing protein